MHCPFEVIDKDLLFNRLIPFRVPSVATFLFEVCVMVILLAWMTFVREELDVEDEPEETEKPA